MKKDIQRAALAVLIGTFAVMTGCDRLNDSNMKGNGNNGKMQDSSKNQGMDKGMNQSAKPMPNGSKDQMHDLNQPPHNGSSSYGGNGGQKKGSSKYHYHCD